jgi:hypothetical protein
LSCVIPEESITQYKKIPLLGHKSKLCFCLSTYAITTPQPDKRGIAKEEKRRESHHQLLNAKPNKAHVSEL